MNNFKKALVDAKLYENFSEDLMLNIMSPKSLISEGMVNVSIANIKDMADYRQDDFDYKYHNYDPCNI